MRLPYFKYLSILSGIFFLYPTSLLPIQFYILFAVSFLFLLQPWSLKNSLFINFSVPALSMLLCFLVFPLSLIFAIPYPYDYLLLYQPLTAFLAINVFSGFRYLNDESIYTKCKNWILLIYFLCLSVSVLASFFPATINALFIFKSQSSHLVRTAAPFTHPYTCAFFFPPFIPFFLRKIFVPDKPYDFIIGLINIALIVYILFKTQSLNAIIALSSQLLYGILLLSRILARKITSLRLNSTGLLRLSLLFLLFLFILNYIRSIDFSILEYGYTRSIRLLDLDPSRSVLVRFENVSFSIDNLFSSLRAFLFGEGLANHLLPEPESSLAYFALRYGLFGITLFLIIPFSWAFSRLNSLSKRIDVSGSYSKDFYELLYLLGPIVFAYLSSIVTTGILLMPKSGIFFWMIISMMHCLYRKQRTDARRNSLPSV